MESHLLLFLKIHLFTFTLSFIQIHSFDKYLRIYHVSGTVTDAGFIAVTKTKIPAFMKFTLGETLYKQKKLEDVVKQVLLI